MNRTRDFERLFDLGIRQFNDRCFWDAHESWEELWLEAESETHRFLQGLIQLAAAYHHCKRGTLRGGVRLFEAAFEKLRDFPAGYCGVDREEAIERATSHRENLTRIVDQADAATRMFDPPVQDSEFPKLTLIEEWQAQIPNNW